MKQIGFKNFRKFENFPMLTLGDITILVGRNNAGKSTMVKAILLLMDNLQGAGYNHYSTIKDDNHPAFRFDAAQPHNTHIGTFSRALNNNAKSDELMLEATFVDNRHDSQINQSREINFTISISITGDKSLNNSVASVSKIRITNNTENTVFVFDFVKNTMSVAMTEEVKQTILKDNQKLLKDWEVLRDTFKKETDPIAAAELSREMKELERRVASIKKSSVMKDFEVNTSLRIFNYIDNFDIVSNLISAFADYCDHPIEVKNKKSKEYKIEKENKLVLHGYAVNFARFANDVSYIISRKNIEYIYAHSVSQKALYSIDDANDYLAKTLHEYYKANISDNISVMTYISQWMQRFQLGHYVKITPIEGEGYTAKVVNTVSQEERHLADLGMGSIQLIVLMLRLAIAIQKYGKSVVKPTIIIEEPEQNLHPAVQSLLAEFFYDVNHTYGLHFVIETHSEYLIRRSQVVVAENSDNEEWKNPFAVYYFPEDDVPYDMKYTKSGRFEEKFGEGFFDTASELNMRIIRKERGL